MRYRIEHREDVSFGGYWSVEPEPTSSVFSLDVVTVDERNRALDEIMVYRAALEAILMHAWTAKVKKIARNALEVGERVRG